MRKRWRIPIYAPAMNSLEEMICLGCGAHFPASTHPGNARVYCSNSCRTVVWQRGGRLTRQDVREIIAGMA